MKQELLSESLRSALQRVEAPTVNALLMQTEGRGVYLVIILVNLPFLFFVPLPGLSVIFGLVVVFLGIRIGLGLPPRLPRFVGDRKLPRQKLFGVINASVKLTRMLERCVRPRRTEWLAWKWALGWNALLLTWLGVLLALPIPPVIPLTNFFPALSIIILAASMMEGDGWMIWIGYLLSLVTTVYFVLIAKATFAIFVGFGRRFF